MTGESVIAEPDDRQSAPAGRGRRKGLKAAIAVACALVLLAAGFATGMSAGRSPIAGYKHDVARLQAELTAERADLSTEKIRLQSAQTATRDALATAQSQVLAQYRSKLAALKQQQGVVAARERRVNAELGRIQASQISADGVYVIGQDIAGGTWHTSGGGGGGFQCYYALLASDNTSDIIDNNNFNGPETVNTAGAHALQISGGCTWVRVG